MSTKNSPGKYNCYHKALPDEPMFVLLARDPDAREVVEFWIKLKRRRGDTSGDKLAEADNCARSMYLWNVAEQEHD